MALLASHLEQISQSAKSIAELEFPPPKIFTNALLANYDITTLIRDTEPHERALFSTDPSVLQRSRQHNGARSPGLENGSHDRRSHFPSTHPTKQSAISRLLDPGMLQELRQLSNNTARSRGGVNVEVLLQGAEKLCNVYAVPGAQEKIRALRSRHREVASSIAVLEERVSAQQSHLNHRHLGTRSEEVVRENDTDNEAMTPEYALGLTPQDFEAEEVEIKALEARKLALEERVSGMERDLGGLLR